MWHYGQTININLLVWIRIPQKIISKQRSKKILKISCTIDIGTANLISNAMRAAIATLKTANATAIASTPLRWSMQQQHLSSILEFHLQMK